MMRLIYLSPVPWSSFTQRPHEFILWFHERFQGDVLWIDPYPARLIKFSDLIRIKKPPNCSFSPVAISSHPWLRIVKPFALPIEPIPGSTKINELFFLKIHKLVKQFMHRHDTFLGIGKPTILSLQILNKYTYVKSFYDAMDDFPQFYSGISSFSTARIEQAIVKRVTRISVSSKELKNRFVSYSAKLVFIPNGCAMDRFPKYDTGRIETDTPVIGYVGTIGSWFDWPLVLTIAKAHPDKIIRLIGPIYSMSCLNLPKNIELLPPCDHASAVKEIQKFNVGIIPFKTTRLTASVDPIKYYEYKAMGIPIISTAFGEMNHRRNVNGVFIIDHSSNSVDIVNNAMKYRADSMDVVEFRQKNSWKTLFDASNILS